MKILVTGAAGFIGYHLCNALCKKNKADVVGLDNLNRYYSVQLKKDRLKNLTPQKRFRFIEADIVDRPRLMEIFKEEKFTHVIHLAAQAGVRYSLENPHAYVDSNVVGFVNMLEAVRHHPVKHFVYASSSSVYGLNRTMPFSVENNVDHPVSLYAATKKSNELMAHTYSHLYKIPTTGLRFFTVYGEWGRPDMAYYSFTKGIIERKKLSIFNEGKMLRDFTYVADVVESVILTCFHPAQPNPSWDGISPDPSSSLAPYRIYNIGNHTPVPLMDFLKCLEKIIGVPAEFEFKPMQPGDVPATAAEVSALKKDIGFAPDTPLEVGLEKFVTWYVDHGKKY